MLVRLKNDFSVRFLHRLMDTFGTEYKPSDDNFEIWARCLKTLIIYVCKEVSRRTVDKPLESFFRYLHGDILRLSGKTVTVGTLNYPYDGNRQITLLFHFLGTAALAAAELNLNALLLSSSPSETDLKTIQNNNEVVIEYVGKMYAISLNYLKGPSVLNGIKTQKKVDSYMFEMSLIADITHEISTQMKWLTFTYKGFQSLFVPSLSLLSRVNGVSFRNYQKEAETTTKANGNGFTLTAFRQDARNVRGVINVMLQELFENDDGVMTALDQYITILTYAEMLRLITRPRGLKIKDIDVFEGLVVARILSDNLPELASEGKYDCASLKVDFKIFKKYFEDKPTAGITVQDTDEQKDEVVITLDTYSSNLKTMVELQSVPTLTEVIQLIEEWNNCVRNNTFEKVEEQNNLIEYQVITTLFALTREFKDLYKLQVKCRQDIDSNLENKAVKSDRLYNYMNFCEKNILYLVDLGHNMITEFARYSHLLESETGTLVKST